MHLGHTALSVNQRPYLIPHYCFWCFYAQGFQALEARSEEISAAADSLRATLRETEERLERANNHLRQSEELRSKEAENARETLDAARKKLEEAEAAATEQSRERSARAAGLQDVLREQGALLAERCALRWSLLGVCSCVLLAPGHNTPTTTSSSIILRSFGL